jgi:hypothetical protein
MNEEARLTEATVTFNIPAGEEKSPSTALSIFVSTRILRSMDVLLASKENFADSDTWRGGAEGESRDYSLNAMPFLLSELCDDVEVRLDWLPTGPVSCTFGCDLEFAFSNGLMWNHHVEAITLDQKSRSWSTSVPLAEVRSSIRFTT